MECPCFDQLIEFPFVVGHFIIFIFYFNQSCFKMGLQNNICCTRAKIPQ